MTGEGLEGSRRGLSWRWGLEARCRREAAEASGEKLRGRGQWKDGPRRTGTRDWTRKRSQKKGLSGSRRKTRDAGRRGRRGQHAAAQGAHLRLKGGKKPHSCSLRPITSRRWVTCTDIKPPLESEDRSGQGTHSTVVSLMEGWLSTKPLAPAESGSTEGS